MCFARDSTIVIAVLLSSWGRGEWLLKYINVGDNSTMVARLPQQVFLLLVLVTGTTMGISMYGAEAPKSARPPRPTWIGEDVTSGGRSRKEMPRKSINRLAQTSTTEYSAPKDDSGNFQTKSSNTNDNRVVRRSQKIHEENVSPKLERFASREESEETWKQSWSWSRVDGEFETARGLRPGRTSGSFLLSSSVGRWSWTTPRTSLTSGSSLEVDEILSEASGASKKTALEALGNLFSGSEAKRGRSKRKIEASSSELFAARKEIPGKYARQGNLALFRRRTRDADEENKCEKFENPLGDESQDTEELPDEGEFFSPNFPDKYPPLTNCVLVLKAEKGKLLKLDFREVFELESRAPNGDCRYDYLEVRDGQYGFSPKIGKYCHTEFPPEIISQSRFLWLNFHSDDTIEYQGFKAVWSTVPRPISDAIPPEQDPCIYEVDIPADYELKNNMIKDAKKLAETNRVALDCLWVLKAGPAMKMQLTFDSFKLEKPNDCSANYLDIFDGQTDEPSRVKTFCGSIAESLSTKTNVMYIRLYLELKAINSSFSALITAVRDKDANQVCKENEYDCDDGTCIAESLKCNNRRNCRFQRDEDEILCGTSSEKQDRSRIIIILVIFSLIMFGMCTAFLFNCVRKLRRDHRIIREHIRQSREDRLDEIGRRATPCPTSVSRTDLREGGSESPAVEEVDSSKELIPASGLSSREYTKELTLQMKYGGVREITDIHQSNNVSNATQERLQESSEEPDMCDSSCQTRESLFGPSILVGSPGFSSFGYEVVADENTGKSRKVSPSSERNFVQQQGHRRHEHPPPFRQVSREGNRENSLVSERCSHEGCAQVCPRHNPIPAPPGWSLHDPPFPQILPDAPVCSPAEENSSYRRYQSPKPELLDSASPSAAIYQQQRCRYPEFARQHTVGSGERYGSFIYGSGRASSSNPPTTATNTTSTSTSSSSPNNASNPNGSCSPQHPRTDPRYRAEAVIEVDQKRPFSIESTKSAPDVIATH